MLKEIVLFGMEIDLYNTCFALGLISVAVIQILLRKRFGYDLKRSVFYSAFTLVFGYLSAMITAWIENGLLTLASNGAYDHFEKIRNYGIPMFLPIFLLVYCLLFGDEFRKLSDYFAPCVYSVMTFIKIGCTFNGCCRGEADPHGIWNADLGYKTFPVQIYDALSSLVIVGVCFALLFTLHKKRKGFVYPIGGMLFALTKGFWETFRVHNSVWEKNYLNTGWTFWQFWMAILFLGCLLWLVLTFVLEKKGVPDFNENPRLLPFYEKLPPVLRFEKKPVRNKGAHKKKKKKK